MTRLKDGDRVEIKDFINGKWRWEGAHGSRRDGTGTETDKHCANVHRESGEVIRDVLEHFRAP